MRHDFRMAGAAAIIAAVLVVAGWSAAADRNEPQIHQLRLGDHEAMALRP